MTRGLFILTQVRKVLSDVGIFDVALAQKPDLDKAVKTEAYAYIIKDTLENMQMEDARLARKLHYIDIGVIFRWNNPTAPNNRGAASEHAADIIGRVETALINNNVIGSEVTDGIRTHRLVQLDVTESYGYMDTSQNVGNTALLMTATIITEIN